MGRATSNFFWPRPLGPWGGAKRSKIFILNFACVLINERYKSDRIFILTPGSCPRGGTFGALGVLRGSFFFKHGHVVYQIDGDDKQNRMQVKFLS